MTNPILSTKDPDPQIYQRIGKIAAEWSWVEMLLSEMLAHFCRAGPVMYVVTQRIATTTITGSLRTLADIQVKDSDAVKAILDLLAEVDIARAERNVIVHGAWRAAAEPGFAWVQTFKWSRQEVVRDELWSTSDLDAVADYIN
ncbi:MAG: hypothetical protein WD407_06215 [Rhodospirillales bacterium]